MDGVIQSHNELANFCLGCSCILLRRAHFDHIVLLPMCKRLCLPPIFEHENRPAKKETSC